MRRAAGLLLLLCGCGTGPYRPFDAGFDVHVILAAKPAPVEVEPICTLGAEVFRSPPRRLEKGQPGAVEVAVFRAPTGRHRLSVWEKRHRVRASVDLDVEEDTWVVVEMRPKESEGKVRVHDYPPVEELGPYILLVPVPD